MLKSIILTMSLIICGVFSSIPQSLAANSEAGSVTRLQSDAKVIREGEELPLEIGSVIRENDEISTDAEARLEITFKDGTTLTIGENARIEIDEYLYEPADKIGNVLIDAVQGPFRFITGKIGKLKEKRVEVRTSAATIGVRGTDFWGGPSAGTYGVFLFEGTIVIFNSQGGRIVSTPGTGVDIDGSNTAPDEALPWSETRAQAAIASVTFR